MRADYASRSRAGQHRSGARFPGACGAKQWASKGLILDHHNLERTSGVATRAANGATLVPKQKELAKAKHQAGTFDKKRWVLLCVAQ